MGRWIEANIFRPLVSIFKFLGEGPKGCWEGQDLGEGGGLRQSGNVSKMPQNL